MSGVSLWITGLRPWAFFEPGLMPVLQLIDLQSAVYVKDTNDFPQLSKKKGNIAMRFSPIHKVVPNREQTSWGKKCYFSREVLFLTLLRQGLRYKLISVWQEWLKTKAVLRHTVPQSTCQHFARGSQMTVLYGDAALDRAERLSFLYRISGSDSTWVESLPITCVQQCKWESRWLSVPAE